MEDALSSGESSPIACSVVSIIVSTCWRRGRTSRSRSHSLDHGSSTVFGITADDRRSLAGCDIIPDISFTCQIMDYRGLV